MLIKYTYVNFTVQPMITCAPNSSLPSNSISLKYKLTLFRYSLKVPRVRGPYLPKGQFCFFVIYVSLCQFHKQNRNVLISLQHLIIVSIWLLISSENNSFFTTHPYKDIIYTTELILLDNRYVTLPHTYINTHEQ